MNLSRIISIAVPGISLVALALASGCNFVDYKDGAQSTGLGQLEPGTVIPSYAAVNQAVFQPYCISCHGSGASIGSLETYAAVYDLRGSIQDQVFVTGAMPQGRVLPTAEKEMLATWLEAGAPEQGGVAPSIPPPAPEPAPVPPSSTLQPTFASLQANVFRSSCMGCHSGSRGSGGISFSTLAQLKAEPHSILDMSVPGNPATSRLVEAITNSSPSVSKMPPGGKSLTSTQIAVIKQWVQLGSP